MLSGEGKNNLEKINKMIKKFWGDSCTSINEKFNDIPFDEFEVFVVLYNKIEIKITYDRSIIGFNIKKHGNFINLRNLTSQKLFTGFESSTEENIEHNFRVLDDELNKQFIEQ
ncbi:MAG: hypothetical protein FWE43_01455 [Streptococcaceae bacterium]|nr:hypothetical protein [Streptococcaceae bacterium]MCL2681143.1 hypothetical protein [Streptococcaceae bacterium]